MGESNCVRVLIGADVRPTPSNELLFSEGDALRLVGEELYKRICQADLRVYNLECPLTDESHAILKDGPVLSALRKTGVGLKALKTDLIVLANNHILDHGHKGAEDTLNVLSQLGIDYIGIGVNAAERSKPYCFAQNGVKICIYNCCEHEFSIMPEGVLGANPYDPLVSFDEISALKKEHDYVVVLYHGGKEYFRYPSPELMRVFRKFAEKGADVVIAQHTHCVGSYEMYQGSLLLYGQGNFIFDLKNNESFKSGMLAELVFTKDAGFTVEMIPVVKNGNAVKHASEEEKETLFREMAERSEKIADADFVRREYNRQAEEYLNQYMEAFHGKSLLDRILNKLLRRKFVTSLIRTSYPVQLLASLYNYVTCEAHLELLRAGLKQRLDKEDR